MLRFAPPEGKIHDLIHDQENKNRRGRTEMNVSLLKSFLQWKVELRNVEGMPPVLLNELLSEFVLTVRTKDGNDYESTSLRGLILPPLNDISYEKLTSLNHQRCSVWENSQVCKSEVVLFFGKCLYFLFPGICKFGCHLSIEF